MEESGSAATRTTTVGRDVGGRFWLLSCGRESGSSVRTSWGCLLCWLGGLQERWSGMGLLVGIVALARCLGAMRNWALVDDFDSSAPLPSPAVALLVDTFWYFWPRNMAVQALFVAVKRRNFAHKGNDCPPFPADKNTLVIFYLERMYILQVLHRSSDDWCWIMRLRLKHTWYGDSIVEICLPLIGMGPASLRGA